MLNTFEYLRSDKPTLLKIFQLATSSDYQDLNYITVHPMFLIIQKFVGNDLKEYIRIDKDLTVERFISEGFIDGKYRFKSVLCENIEAIEDLIKCLSK